MRCALLLLCSMLSATSARAQSANAADEKAVRDIVQRYVDARERRDGEALAALFTADADQFTTSGDWRRGREAVVKGGLASSQRNAGRRTITVESVRFIAPGVAIADGPYAIEGGSGTEARPMWTTIVAMRGPEGWRIAAIRNALPAPR